jgi:hypothetical protein
MKVSSLLLALGCVAVSAFKESDYSNSKEITSDYKLWWKVEGDVFKLAMRARTLGWVAFGITEQASGSMPGTDMVMGQITDGVATITDSYAISFETPLVDDTQDWFEPAGFVEDGFTTITASRKLKTGDSFDRVIEDLGFPLRIAGAWGDVSDDGRWNYHTPSNRKLDRINVFNSFEDPADLLLKELARPGTTLKSWTVTNDKFLIPTKRTTYHDLCFKVHFARPHTISTSNLLFLRGSPSPRPMCRPIHFTKLRRSQKTCMWWPFLTFCPRIL